MSVYRLKKTGVVFFPEQGKAPLPPPLSLQKNSRGFCFDPSLDSRLPLSGQRKSAEKGVSPHGDGGGQRRRRRRLRGGAQEANPREPQAPRGFGHNQDGQELDPGYQTAGQAPVRAPSPGRSSRSPPKSGAPPGPGTRFRTRMIFLMMMMMMNLCAVEGLVEVQKMEGGALEEFLLINNNRVLLTELRNSKIVLTLAAYRLLSPWFDHMYLAAFGLVSLLGFVKIICLPLSKMVLEDEEGGEFDVVYIGNRTGLGGGWRGFSMHHDLEDGDSLVVELAEPDRFKIYIFKATEDTNEAKPGDKTAGVDIMDSDSAQEEPDQTDSPVSETPSSPEPLKGAKRRKLHGQQQFSC